MSKKISFVIPCYNESERIKENFRELMFYLQDKSFRWEIIFIDDGSTDNTLKVLNELADLNGNIQILCNKKNRGKGASIKKGVLQASGDITLFTDADFSTPINQFDLIFPLFDKYDVVIGIRKHKNAKIIKRQPFYREFMGNFFTSLSNLILLNNINDVTCGFKAFNKKAYIKIFKKQKIHRWAFDTEVLFLAKKYGFKLFQFPVTWKNDERTKVYVLRDTFVSLIDLFRIKIYDLLGKYG